MDARQSRNRHHPQQRILSKKRGQRQQTKGRYGRTYKHSIPRPQEDLHGRVQKRKCSRNRNIQQ